MDHLQRILPLAKTARLSNARNGIRLNTSARAQREDGETKCVAGRHPERSGVLETEERRAIRAECSPAEARRRRGREAGDPGHRIGVCAVRRLGKLACQIAWPHSPRSSLREVRPPLSLVQHTNKSSAPLRPCGRIPLTPSCLRGCLPGYPSTFPILQGAVVRVFA